MIRSAILAAVLFSAAGDPEREVGAFLAKYDAAHASGRVEDVVALLATTPANARAATEGWLREFFGSARVERRTSRVLGVRAAPEALGAYLEVDLRLAPAPGVKGGFARERRQHEFLLLRREGGDLRLARRLDFLPAVPLAADGDPAGCDACGWNVTPPAGWFAVPSSRASTGATDALTFVPSDGETTIDLLVRQAVDDWDPLRATRLDDDRVHRDAGSPPAFREILRRSRPRSDERLEAESEVSIPLGPGTEGRVLRRYLASGPILFAFVAYGAASKVDRIREDFASLFGSFEVKEDDRLPAERMDAILAAHQPGAQLAGHRFTYRGSSFRLDFAGPEAWKAIHLTAPGPFRVCYRCPTSRASIDAYASSRTPGWSSAESIVAELDGREEEIRKCGARSVTPVAPRAEVSLSGLAGPAYRTDLAWKDEDGAPVRERCLLIPLPDAAVFLRVFSPEDAFDLAAEAFESLLETLRLE